MGEEKPLTSHTVTLSPEQEEKLRTLLASKGFRPMEVPYARFAAKGPDVSVAVYKKGKLLVQGKGTRDFVEFILEPEILGEARLGYEDYWNPERLTPRIGIDESGKGDFFGPLCVAAVYVNEEGVRALEKAGVRDSKRVGSDAKLQALAKAIRAAPGCAAELVLIGNEAYNRLYPKMKNVNRVLAWGHARALENILAHPERLNPPPAKAVSDQFASSKQVIRRALLAKGRDIVLEQRHKAESDIAVAAASILAREMFLRRLTVLSQRFGVALPKGAGPAVDAAAKELVEIHGPQVLRQTAKLHFVNARRAGFVPKEGSSNSAAS